jgi:2-dehydro-3-deoxyphosphogluconate aldolase/(4S)-4-hydroxy-2-oxoglutarate aldolase
MELKTEKILKIMKTAPVVPVLVVDDIEASVKLAQALVNGGLPAIEVTLRTPTALDCIKAISDQVEGAIMGAGTIITADDVKKVEALNVEFMVSPGMSHELIDAAKDTDIALLPGAATASEVMGLGEEGYRALKFFPAEQAGGASYLKSLGSPLPDFTFCPTGGVNLKNAPDYLALNNVACVGGSWVAPKDLVAQGDWAAIEKLAREASQL